MELEKTEHQLHCDNCFNIAKCGKEQKQLIRAKVNVNTNIVNKDKAKKPGGNGEIKLIDCQIIKCRLGCGHIFHACKEIEHQEHICRHWVIPCINGQYGCPHSFQRRFLAKHLSKCPASVIVCTMEWSRWPILKGKPFQFDNPAQLDVASCLYDEEVMTQFKETLPTKLKKRLLNYSTERHPVMGLGVAGRRIPNYIRSEGIEETLRSNGTLQSSESTETDEDAKGGVPGLQESVCTKLFDNIHLDDQKGKNKEKANNNNDNKIEKKKRVELNVVVEVITRYLKKPDSIYTFMCAQEFRRDEYSDHFLDVHSNIHSQCNGWLFTRCPLSSEGCSFGLERLTPFDSNHKVIFNKETQNSFCFTQVNTTQFEPDPESEKPSLTNLPFEILLLLTKYLDPLSLNALSMTNSLLRLVCECVVVERGIVVLDWDKKNEDGGWEIVAKKWIFSTSFSPISKWKYEEIGRMSNHMKNCQYFDRNVPMRPFSYPVFKDQL